MAATAERRKSTRASIAQRNVPIGLWMALLLIVLPSSALIGLLTYQGFSRLPRLSADRESVARAFQTITTAQQLKTALQDAERGQRGYLLTGEAVYLAPYDAAAREIPELLARLQRLTTANAAQARRMPVLVHEIDAKRLELYRGLEVYEHEGLKAAQAILHTNAGLDAMRSVESMIDAAVEAENALLTLRLMRAAQDERGIARAALTGGALAFLLMVTGVVLTFVVFRQARRLEAERRSEEQRLAAELSRSQAVLAHAQKMEALGQLTGGIAHDFNNLLHVIRNAVEVAQRRLRVADPAVRHYLDMAQRNTDRAASTTARLLAFARRQPLDPKPIDANSLISGMTDLLRHTLGTGINMDYVPNRSLWITSVDANQLETAILNLVVNARDAMGVMGTLTIETLNAEVADAHAARDRGLTPGRYVVIAVSDTGTGMTQEVLGRAFEPFFTTKEAGQGTGLGLSQVFGFIKQSGGYVKISSEPRAGTTVKLYLPRSEGTPPAVAPSAPTTQDGAQGETILLVEDNEDARTFAAEALGELGYRVLVAADAYVALSVLETLSDISLLFTDIGLPNGMTGRQLAAEVRRLRPQIKVLFTTGYAQNALIHEGRLDPAVELLVKPFTSSNLARKVRQVLDADRETLQ